MRVEEIPAGLKDTPSSSKNMENRLEPLLEKMRKELRPSKSELESLKKAELELRERLERHLPKDVEIGVMGSVAKGTALSNNRDLDIFLLFGQNYSPQQVKTKAILWAKKAMRGYECELNYAQHPYLKVKMPGVKVDIVPSFKIKNNEKLKTAVDRSQLHTVWVNAKIDSRMQDDVRLLKQFLKTLGVYGAQSRVEGFSGYLCELLIIKYGSFEKLLKEADSWNRPIIDIEGYHTLEQTVKMFEKAPMIVIDPVDKNRNVAAVVSRTSLSRFILAARNFLKTPSREFFFAKKISPAKSEIHSAVKRRDTHMIILQFEPPKLVEDVLWPQLKKTAHAIIAKLSRDEFRVFGHYFYADDKYAFILIELMDWRLPALKRVLGPDVSFEKHVPAFVKMHKNAENLHAEHERIVALEKRKNIYPKESIEDAIRKPKESGIPPEFAAALRKRNYRDAKWLASERRLREIASDYLFRKL